MTPVDYIHEDPYCTVYNGTQDPLAINLYKKRAACRYHQISRCRRGSNCSFVHTSTASQAETSAISYTMHQSGLMYNYQHLGPTPVYRLLDSQPYPLFLWQPYPLSTSFDPRYGPTHRAETFPDYPDDKSDPSSVESLSTMASIDYQQRVAHDKAQMEHVQSRSIQVTASPSGDVAPNLAPGYTAYPVLPEYVAGRGRASSLQSQGKTVGVSSSPLASGQKDLRKRPLAYKTKPCKFYAVNGKCTSGENCTFIHDLASRGNEEGLLSKLSPPIGAKLPPKPLNKYDECRARDFYPVSWRVIGGGVMMGGQRQICPAFAAGHCTHGNDCKFAHETELETDPVGFIELKSEPSPRKSNRSVKRTHSNSQRPKSVKPLSQGVQHPIPSPSTTPHPNGCAAGRTEGVGKKGDEAAGPSSQCVPTPPPVRRRTRSMSMVLTSPLPLDTTQSNYAAEL